MMVTCSVKACRLRLEHVPSAKARANSSRVRVDSLTLFAVSNKTGPCPRTDHAPPAMVIVKP